MKKMKNAVSNQDSTLLNNDKGTFDINKVRLSDIRSYLIEEISSASSLKQIEQIFDRTKIKTHFMRETIDKHLTIIGKHASTFDGYIFGGVVRNFLVGGRDTKDIDIWFKNIESSQLFIQTLMDYNYINIEPNKKYYNSKKTDFYPFLNESYTFIMPDKFSFIVNIHVKETYPVDDFYVNDLIYDGLKIKHISENPNLLDQAMRDIINKNMYPKEQFIERYLNNKNNQKLNLKLKELKASGWFLGQLDDYIIV